MTHDSTPAGPACADTWLAENSQPEPKMAPSPMNVRSVRPRFLWNLPCVANVTLRGLACSLQGIPKNPGRVLSRAHGVPRVACTACTKRRHARCELHRARSARYSSERFFGVTIDALALVVRVRRLAAAFNETGDALVQYRQRYRAGRQHRVVEGAQIELVAQRLFGARTLL